MKSNEERNASFEKSAGFASISLGMSVVGIHRSSFVALVGSMARLIAQAVINFSGDIPSICSCPQQISSSISTNRFSLAIYQRIVTSPARCVGKCSKRSRTGTFFLELAILGFSGPRLLTYMLFIIFPILMDLYCSRYMTPFFFLRLTDMWGGIHPRG